MDRGYEGHHQLPRCQARVFEMSGKLAETIQAAREMGFEVQDRSQSEQTNPTVIEAIKALDNVCDGAATKDGCGFSKFDREENDDLIKKAISEGYLSSKEEKTAYRFLKKYKKQLKELGVAYDDIGHIARDAEDNDNGLSEINERIPEWIAEHHFKTVKDTERLYRYDRGVYLDDGETILKALLESEFLNGLPGVLKKRRVIMLFNIWFRNIWQK